MRITRFEYQKKDSSRVNIFSDDGYMFSIHAGLLVKEQLAIGSDLDDAQVIHLLRTDIAYRIYSRAISYIARGPKSTKQMSDYLNKVVSQRIKDWSTERIDDIDIPSMVDSTIERLVREGLVNDEEFGKQYIASLLSRKPHSILELRAKLQKYGISRELIDRLLNELDGDEVKMAKLALEKRFHTTQLTRKDMKMIQFLQRKGYNWEVISKLLNDDI